MLKTHSTYLARLVAVAARLKDSDMILQAAQTRKPPDRLEYRLIHDIVCDARFYSVLEETPFWKEYAPSQVGAFIDSLTDEESGDESRLTMRKEEFLNRWMAAHLMEVDERRPPWRREMFRVRSDEEKTGVKADGDGEGDEGEYGEEVELERGIRDMTDTAPKPNPTLPRHMKEMDVKTEEAAPGHQAEARFLRGIDPALRELALSIGRHGESSEEPTGEFVAATRSDIAGVTVGDDLNMVLPSELALLGTTRTERIFYDRFLRRKLQLFSSASRSCQEFKERKGPIYICVDTSGSMAGEPEIMAKTLALAVILIAQKEKRPVCMVNYSYDLSFFIMKDYDRQRRRFFSFLSHSYSGGNNENRLFHFLFDLLPEHPRFLSMKNLFEGADMLMVSDFNWSGVSDENLSRLAKARADGMQLYGLGVEVSEEDLTDNERNDFLFAGLRFLNSSDHIYLFSEGRVKKVSG